MRIFTFVVLVYAIILLSPGKVLAESSYVLPYPSAMPGSVFYKLDLVKEFLMKYWYFGDLAQFDFNLQESDKYLVEAKTLFEYKQYLLGYYALIKSDNYFKLAKPHLKDAENHGKNIDDKVKILDNAAAKHIEVLEEVKRQVPANIYWQPEKSKGTNLDLINTINYSIKIRGSAI